MTRVFILSHHAMFGRGLESLLRHEAEIELVGQEADEQKAIEQIKVLQPDVVIWDSHEAPDGPGPAIMRILRENPGIKVVGLSLRDNNLYLYQVTQRVVQGLDELIEAIAFSPMSTSTPQKSIGDYH